MSISPHNATMTILGAALLWFGWFGFNAGSALGANGQAINALVTTNTAAAAGALTWLLLGWLMHSKPSAIGAAVGAVAGLVGITPAAGFVTPMSAILIGSLTTTTCFFVTEYLMRGRIDDSLDVFGVHGVGGIVGALLTGVFATTGGGSGLIDGNPGQVLIQLKAVLVVAAYTAIVTAAIVGLLKATVGIRVTDEEEEAGLDLSQHGEIAYPTA